MLSKIRKILLDRCEQDLQSDKWINSTEKKDIEGKLDAIGNSLISLKSIIRISDDRLIMELFNAQERWHMTTVELVRVNQELNKRLISLEEHIFKIMMKE